MSSPVSLASVHAGLAINTSAPSEKAQLAEVAQQFEAIFLRQVLATARQTDFGGDDLLGGQGEDTFREMQDAQFADIAAKSGMIGFASSIEAQLARYIKPEG